MTRKRARTSPGDQGFTIVELTVALGLLAVVAASLSGVFWSAIRTAGVANHRTQGAAIASREIESMRSVKYDEIGLYADQSGYVSSFEGYETVTRGATTPAGSPSLIQPLTPDPKAAADFVPNPDPANATPIRQGGIDFSVRRDVVWIDAQDPSDTYAQAYKRITVVVTWSDRAGPHTARQDSIVYPGGQGAYSGPKGAGAPTTTTVFAPTAPDAPTLQPPVVPADPAGQTQVALTWDPPAAGAAVTTYSIVYSTDPSFPAGQITVISGLAPTVTSYTVTSLSADTLYYFEVIAYAGTNASPPSNVQSAQTLPPTAPTCTLGPLSVTGATSKSTTGSILTKAGRMSENLTLAWTTTGTCSGSYVVRAVNSSGTADPGSPYSLTASGAGSYSGSILSANDKGWATGVHTFTIFDLTTGSYTSVVKTFNICVSGSSSC